MPKVYKLSVGGLKRIIATEKAALMREAATSGFGPLGDVTKAKADEVEADEYADTLEKEIDHLKAAKVQEAKLLVSLKRVRQGMRERQRRIQEARAARRG